MTAANFPCGGWGTSNGTPESLNSGLGGVFPCRLITLEVHSALDAVGFLAAVTARLAAEGIGVNPVAGFHHDHLFVPADKGVVEDLIVAAANDARTKVEQTVQEQMRSITGGMALPPGFKL